MGSVDEHVGMSLLGHIPVKVPRVEKICELASAILTVWAAVLVDLVQTGEFGILGRHPVKVTRLVADTDDITALCGFLHHW